jgi:hypothetical protein
MEAVRVDHGRPPDDTSSYDSGSDYGGYLTRTWWYGGTAYTFTWGEYVTGCEESVYRT